MEELLVTLENKIRNVVEERESLQASSQHLYQNTARLVKDKNLLLSKLQTAIQQIESLVAKLQELDKVPRAKHEQ